MTWYCERRIEDANGNYIRDCNTKFEAASTHIDKGVKCPSCGTDAKYCCIGPYNPRKHG